MVSGGTFKHRVKQAKRAQKIRTSVHGHGSTRSLTTTMKELREETIMPSAKVTPLSAFLPVEDQQYVGLAGTMASCGKCFLTVPIHTIRLNKDGSDKGCEECS